MTDRSTPLKRLLAAEYSREYRLRPENQLRLAEYAKRAKARYSANRDAINTQRREKYKADPQYRSTHRSGNIQWLYGISKGEYDRILDQQGDVCAVCGLHETSTTRKQLSVDHDHCTGKVRGLLCVRCNSALGLVGENVIILKNLIAYVRKHARTER